MSSTSSKKVLISLSLKYNGNWDKIYKAISDKEEPEEKYLELADLDEYKEVITILDEDYPDGMKKIEKPPFVLFYKGNKSFLNESRQIRVGLMGGEIEDKPEEYTRIIMATKSLIKHGFTTVVQLNKGADEVALRACLKIAETRHNKIIVIARTGLDEVDKTLKDIIELTDLSNGNIVFISELPNGVKKEDKTLNYFRLVKALSENVIVTSLKRSEKECVMTFLSSIGTTYYGIPRDYLYEDDCINELIGEGMSIFLGDKTLKEILEDIDEVEVIE